MLFKQKILQDIQSGKISLAFRKWKKPSVKKKSLLKTRIGRFEIVDIQEVDINKITNGEAAKAGYDHLDSLLEKLNLRKEGLIY